MGNDRAGVRAWRSVLCLLALWLPLMAHAQTHTPEDEYKDLIRVSQDIQPLGEHPFGANIGLYSGSLSFLQTDVSLAGNGPLLQLSRSFEIEGSDGFGGRADKAFGDWDIALPRIETLVAQGWFWSSANGWQEANGWQVNAAGDTNLRCANFNEPLSVTTMPNVPGLMPWDPVTWWHGYHLVVPGHGSHDLLSNAGTNEATYPAVTKDHWRISCINETTTANGEPGDGFIAHAPDGTRYWFNELVYRWAPTMERPLDSVLADIRPGQRGPASLLNRRLLAKFLGILTGSAPAHAAPDHDFLQRREAWMLVTKIEDRFGNTLVFSYDANGQLTKIEASDGRKLTVQRVAGTHRIHSVTLESSNAAARVWTYGYDADITNRPRLTSVTLPGPDGRQWQFNLVEFDRDATLEVGGFHSCNTLGQPVNATWTGSITHPSGLTGQFTVHPAKHGRSHVPRNCRGMMQPYGFDDPDSYAVLPNAWYSYTITSKTFTGAGMSPDHTWSYSYAPANASWSDQCTGGCASTVWTQVNNPDGSSVKYTFSNRFDYSETQLKRTDYYSGDATGLLRRVDNTYTTATGHPWPDRVGYNLQNRINSEQTERRSPLSERVIQQAGDSYTWQAEAFNQYAQVTQTKRFSSVAGQQPIEEAITYHNDTTLWVLGLPDTRTNLTTGEVVRDNSYNTLDLLTARTHFGPTVMTYAWNTAGQLASFTDANSHTTTLGNYQRGIPQTISYPDGTSQHLSVDDFGQIASITDQAGHTTSYTYDAVGRLTQITYPAGGVAWYPKTFSYQYVTGAERGLAGGHWKRTVSQGNARHVTYYDVLLRPVLTDTYISGGSTPHISASTAYNWKGLTTFQSWPVTGSPALGSSTLTGTTTTYDALGRVTAVSQPSELGTPITTTSSYLSGARKRITDPEGHVTTLSYQVFDQPSYKVVTQVQAPEGIVQSISRDIYGHPVAITQSGPDGLGGSVSITKHLYYDGQYRLCRSAEPETGSTVMDYDAAGNLLWSAQGQAIAGGGCGTAPTGSHTTRTYDAMNRLTSVTYPDGHGDTATSYDAVGHVSSIQASTASGPVLWTYAYDNLGHLTIETLGVDGYAWPIHYAYAANAALSQVTYPDGKRVAYAPDALGRPTQAGAYATSASYFPDGALAYFVFGNGTAYVASRNDRQLLSNLTYDNGTLQISRDYSYDANANLTAVNDLVGLADKTLTYDALNRLTSAHATGLWGTASYGYDSLNNLRQLTSDGLMRTYNYDTANRLTSITSGSTTLHTFAYDLRGNVTQMDSQGRVFSKAHRLLQIPGTASYVYDAAGRRVKAVDAGGLATYYVYNRAGHLMMGWSKATDTTTDYVYLGKKLIAEIATAPLPPANAPNLGAPATDADGNYTVSWGGVSDATRYTLEEQTDGGSWSTVYSGGNLSQAVTGKGNDSYGYRIQACNIAGCSGWSGIQTVVVTHSPGSAPSLTVPSSNHSGSYTVSWSAVATATSYHLQERTGSGSWSTIYSGTSRSKAASGKDNGSYGYRVQACNAGGCGNWSATETVTVLLPPPVPGGLSVPSADNNGSYTVSWNAASTATSYTLEERTNGGSWSTEYRGTGRSKGESGKGAGSYGYRVRACNGGGCSGWSGVQTVVVTYPPASAPGLSGPGSDSNGYYTVSWTVVATATSYTLQERRNSASWSTIYSGGSRSKARSAMGDATYGYRVHACNAGGCGPWSATRNVVVVHPPSGAPSLSVPGSNHDGSYTVSWGSVSRATSYQLQERKNSGSWSTVYTGGSRNRGRSGKTDGSYGYRVKACNASGCGPWSATDTVSVAIIPPVPSNVYVNEYGSYKYIYQDLVWDAVSGASHYEVKTSSDSTVVNVGTATSYHLRTYPVPSFPPPLTGYVRACNSNGCSAWASARAN